jgi:hypothetical protein
MRKRLCVALLVLAGFTLKAQVPNSGFEILNSNNNTAFWGEAHLITIWLDSSGAHTDSILYDDPGGRLYFPTTDAYQGMYALELRNAFNYTTGSPMVGNAKLSADSNDYSAFGGNFVAVVQHPLDLSFYYKFFPAGPDTATATISVYDSMGVEIGNRTIEITDMANSYTYVSEHINYFLPGVAAYISMEFYNAKQGSPVTFGTRFQIDEVNLNMVGLKEKNGPGEELICYPMPVTDVLRVRSNGLSGHLQGHIADMLGNIVLQLDENYTYSAAVDVTSLAPGVYIIEVQSPEGLIKKKFVRQ